MSCPFSQEAEKAWAEHCWFSSHRTRLLTLANSVAWRVFMNVSGCAASVASAFNCVRCPRGFSSALVGLSRWENPSRLSLALLHRRDFSFLPFFVFLPPLAETATQATEVRTKRRRERKRKIIRRSTQEGNPIND